MSRQTRQAGKKHRKASLFLLLLLLAVLFVGIFTVPGQNIRLWLHDLFSQTPDTLLCPRHYTDYVTRYAALYGIPENLLYAVIQTESDFQPEATSSKGAKGLMQLMPQTFLWLAERLDAVPEEPETAIFDPELNIRCGAYYLSFLYSRFGRWTEVAAAYNAGQGRVAEWLTDATLTDENGNLLPDAIPYAETRRYVEKIRAAYEAYEARYPSENPIVFDGFN